MERCFSATAPFVPYVDDIEPGWKSESQVSLLSLVSVIGFFESKIPAEVKENPSAIRST